MSFCSFHTFFLHSTVQTPIDVKASRHPAQKKVSFTILVPLFGFFRLLPSASSSCWYFAKYLRRWSVAEFSARGSRSSTSQWRRFTMLEDSAVKKLRQDGKSSGVLINSPTSAHDGAQPIKCLSRINYMPRLRINDHCFRGRRWSQSPIGMARNSSLSEQKTWPELSRHAKVDNYSRINERFTNGDDTVDKYRQIRWHGQYFKFVSANAGFGDRKNWVTS